MDPIEERDIEKVLQMLDDPKIHEKVLKIVLDGIQSGQIKMQLDFMKLFQVEDFRVGVKSIIVEYNEEMKKQKEEINNDESSA